MKHAYMNLQLFAEEAGATPPAAAETGTAAEMGTEAAEINAGDQLANGAQVPNSRVAAAMNRQMRRHPELRKVYGQGPQGDAPQQNQPNTQPADGQTPDGNSLDERWNELRKGEFKDLYARDVQAAIKDRFKNQEDANQKLTNMQPMLDALMKKAGVDNVEALQAMILDDDSLYEEEAEAMGMPVEAYKNFKKLQEEHDAAIKAQQQSQEQQMFRQHIAGLVRQGEEFKQTFPGFDFNTEMQNPNFRKLTSPEIGLSVADAYFAIHRNELTPQLMGYGMQKARQQMSQTLQAQAARPAEGAMRAGVQAADVRINPKTMTRKERQAIKDRVRRGEVVSFD